MKSDDLIKQVHQSFEFMVNRSTLSDKKVNLNEYTEEYKEEFLEIKCGMVFFAVCLI